MLPLEAALPPLLPANAHAPCSAARSMALAVRDRPPDPSPRTQDSVCSMEPCMMCSVALCVPPGSLSRTCCPAMLTTRSLCSVEAPALVLPRLARLAVMVLVVTVVVVVVVDMEVALTRLNEPATGGGVGQPLSACVAIDRGHQKHGYSGT